LISALRGIGAEKNTARIDVDGGSVIVCLEAKITLTIDFGTLLRPVVVFQRQSAVLSLSQQAMHAASSLNSYLNEI